MTATTSTRATAGAAYTSALAAAIDAYVTLAANERALGISTPPGGHFGAETPDLIAWRHPVYAPRPDAPRFEDLIQAKILTL